MRLAAILAPSFLYRLEELDGVARRILQENLQAAKAGNDVIAKVGARLPERGDNRIQIIHFELNPVPSSGFGPPTIRHRLCRASLTSGCAQQQTQLAIRDCGKSWAWVHLDLEV